MAQIRTRKRQTFLINNSLTLVLKATYSAVAFRATYVDITNRFIARYRSAEHHGLRDRAPPLCSVSWPLETALLEPTAEHHRLSDRVSPHRPVH